MEPSAAMVKYVAYTTAEIGLDVMVTILVDGPHLLPESLIGW